MDKRLLLYVFLAPTLVIISLAASNHILWPHFIFQYEPLHSTVETIGAVAAIFTAVLILQKHSDEGAGKLAWIAAGLLGSGILNMFHAAASPGNGLILLHVAEALFAGIGFALVWLPERFAAVWLRKRAVFSIIATATGFGIWTLAFQQTLPQMAINGKFTAAATVTSIITSILFLAAAWRLLADSQRSHKPEPYLFSIMALLFSISEFSFTSSTLWDDDWWWWHLVRLLGYVIALGFLAYRYRHTEIALRLETTERKQAQELYQTLAESSTVGVYIVQDGRFQFVNPQFQKITGYNAEELMARSPYSIVHPDDREQARLNATQRLKRNLFSPYEFRIIRKDGETIWAIENVVSVNYRGRRASMDTLMDITEKKLAEKNLEHLNGILLTVRNINQLIVEVNEEGYLLRQACEILAEGRSYKMAWVGFVSEGSYDVLPAAQAGFDEGHGFAVRTTWDDSEYGCGPAGTAIKSGHACIVTDIANDESFRPWREQALKYGCQSTASIPLRVGGRIIGVLTVSSGLPDAFDQTEMDMLIELAGDIGLGIHNLRQRKALQLSEEKYRKLVDNALVGVFSSTTKGEILVVNEALVKMLEFETAEEFKAGGALLRYKNPSDRAIMLKELAEKGKVNGFENEVLTKNGAVKNILVSAVLDGEVLSGIVVDITSRRQAETAASDIKKRFDKLVARLNDVVWSANADGSRIIDINEAFERIYGRPTDILNQNPSLWLDIVHPDDRAIAAASGQTLFANGSATAEYRIVRPDGTIRWIEDRKVLFYDESGNVIGMGGVGSDITERKLAEQREKEIQAQLMAQDRLATVGQLAAGVAHEMNNPLTGVLGFSELLLARQDLPPEIREDVEIINREAQRTAAVVRGPLTFSRKQKTDRGPVDVNKVIQSVLQLRAYEHRVSNIEIDMRLFEKLPPVSGNGAQLQQVFINLVVNAEHAMLEAHRKGKLTITTERTGNTLHVSIADDGPGISPENMKKLFTPFFTTKEVGKGTGLGLSICHGIITDHGGRIYAESEPGKGSIFIIELPAGG